MRRDAEKEKFWREAVAEAYGGGQSVREFCQARGLKENQFYAWRRELRLRDAEASDRPGFVELVRPSGSSGAGVSVRIDERIAIVLDRGFDRDVLKAALSCLREAGKSAVVAEVGRA